MLLLQQMIVLFIYIIIGYGAAKKGVADEEFSRKLSWVVVNVANPALTVSAVVNGEGTVRGRDLLLTAGLAIIILGGTILVAQIVPVSFRIKKEERRAYILLSSFNNIGFMGFPVIAAVYGETALVYAAVFMMIFNVLVYTYGIWAIRGGEWQKIQWGQIFNIGVIGSILAIVIYLAGIRTPVFFNVTMSGLGGLTAPLSMIVIGSSLTKISLKELFADGRLLLYSAVKLLVVPIAAMAVITRALDNEMLCGVCMIMMSTPSASMTAMLAKQYGSKRDADITAKGVALTTLLSVITIPVVSAAAF